MGCFIVFYVTFQLFNRSSCFISEKLALKYYDVLTAKLYQGVPKVVSGVAQNTKVIVEYQPEVNTYHWH